MSPAWHPYPETHVTPPLHPAMKLSQSTNSDISAVARLFVLALLPVATLAQACFLQSASSGLRLTQHVCDSGDLAHWELIIRWGKRSSNGHHFHLPHHLDWSWAKQFTNDTRHNDRYHFHSKQQSGQFWQQHEPTHLPHHNQNQYPPTFNCPR